MLSYSLYTIYILLALIINNSKISIPQTEVQFYVCRINKVCNAVETGANS